MSVSAIYQFLGVLQEIKVLRKAFNIWPHHVCFYALAGLTFRLFRRVAWQTVQGFVVRHYKDYVSKVNWRLHLYSPDTV